MTERSPGTPIIAQYTSELRSGYLDLKSALPWFDACLRPDDGPAWPRYARAATTPGADAAVLPVASARIRRDCIYCYRVDQAPPLDALADTLAALESHAAPLALLHTEVELDAMRALAGRYPGLPLIIESGPRKLLYHTDEIIRTLRECDNVHLCTYNYCSWSGLEDLCGRGLAERLLYGSHAPRCGEDFAMGPIAMSQLTWEQKCGIAGNNLRRLLGLPTVSPPQVGFNPSPPFIIDAHAHSVRRGETTVNPFPSPDQAFETVDWLAFMDACGLERLFLMPAEPLFDPALSCRDYMRDLIAAAPHRFNYLEVYNPQGDAAHELRTRDALQDPQCVGLKIHPTAHRVAADDDRYATAYELAAACGKPVMTHSWENSDYNPHQHLSHPDRFRRWLEAFPGVRLVLGHAGGRPSTFESVVALCREYAQLRVDISGDYYDNGLVDALVGELGVDRVLFGSDLDWFDPRCHMAMVLGSTLSDADVARVLRGNAEATYGA